jgi:glycosylphosphatidylinositol transamidase
MSLRRDPRILKLPPYLSLLCICVGVVWLFLLPLDDYSRRNYISENALLPGQVHTYFGGSEQNILRAYRHELGALDANDNYAYVCVLPVCVLPSIEPLTLVLASTTSWRASSAA